MDRRVLVVMFVVLHVTGSAALSHFNISTDGRCGPAVGLKCPAGSCCSSEGFCGIGVKFCASANCQRGYGMCARVPSTPAASLRGRLTGEVVPPVPGAEVFTCGTPGTFAITYDDGPYIYSNELIDVLDAAGVKATLFICGDNFVDIYEPEYQAILKKAYASGHQIASHTWSHQDLVTLTDARIVAQMTLLDDALRTIIGVAPTYMRPPYGSSNARVLGVLKTLNYRSIQWDVDTNDWDHPNDVEKSLQAYRDALKNASPETDQFIALEHEVYQKTVIPFTPEAIALVRSYNYTLTTVAECWNDPNPYKA